MPTPYPKLVSFKSGIADPGVVLCIAQLARTVSDITKDRPAPANVATVKRLLTSTPGDGGLLDYASARKTILLVCPEFAFSGGDWLEIDALVREFPQSLIVAAGFGLSAHSTLQNIMVAENVRWCWEDPRLPAASRFNFGALWVHRGKGLAAHEPPTECFLFGKTFPEQAHEAQLGVHTFDSHARIELDDAVLWPFICAEALRDGGPSTVVLNINQDDQSPQKPRLALGLLFQSARQGDLRWYSSISSIAARERDGTSTVVIANAATARIHSGDMRNLSGVYACFGPKPQVAHSCRLHGINQDALASWRLRTAESAAVVCELNLSPHSATTGIYHVLSRHHWRVDEQGGLAPDNRCSLGLDLCAATDLVTELPADDATHAQALRKPLSLLRRGTVSNLRAIAESWLSGPIKGGPHPQCVDDSHDRKRVEALHLCAQAMGGLHSPPRTRSSLIVDFGVPAGFSASDYRFANGSLAGTPVWFWNDPHQSAIQMKSALRDAIEKRALQPGSMLVFGRGAESDFDRGRLNNSAVSRRPDQPAESFVLDPARTRLPTTSPRERSRNVSLQSLGWAATLWTDSSSAASFAIADVDYNDWLDALDLT